MNLKGRQFSIFRFFSDFCFSSPPDGTWCYKTLEKKFTQINNFLKRFTFLQTLDVIYGFPLIISIFFSFYLQKYFGCGGKGTLSPAHPVAAILAGGAGRRLGRRWVEFSDWSKTSDVHHLEKRRLHLLVTIYFPSFRPPFSSYLFKEMVNLVSFMTLFSTFHTVLGVDVFWLHLSLSRRSRPSVVVGMSVSLVDNLSYSFIFHIRG